MQEKLDQLEQGLRDIQDRNRRVEGEKAWETSFFRKASITLVTYVVAAAVMYFIGVEDYLLNAFIPTIGYVLSTLSLPYVKRWWISNRFHS